ncbi:hypothetical protein [Mycobacterium scrofulaceum]|uniref:Uncharacterized protein n=1 Tax=Mycobacterium scrofulaceum TaxID=1783 RepID=A0A1X0KDZ5_MYCSC|nr:hypothetical protein [Mycobacterium scrofulaceum]ORB73128.1 hypothetical protein BST44_16305 [Mycobacterium scrofulaceum]
MFRIQDTNKVVSISTSGGKPWYVEPGSLVVDGEILRFRLNRSGLLMQIHADEVATIISEDE